MHRIMNVNVLIDIFISPSQFLRNKMIEYGFQGDNIICLNNFNELEPNNDSSASDNYYLYALWTGFRL